MSWQTYVDEHMKYEISPGHSLTAAAIIGHDGSVRAQSAKFPKAKSGEYAAILVGFEEHSPLAQRGLFLGGQKYVVIQGDPGIVIRGKKRNGGITIRKTKSALIIGIYDVATIAGKRSVVVEKIGDFMDEQGN